MRVGLIGNPNSGKTTIFNQLTGLRQKTGNFPGITTDVQIGHSQISNERVEIVDFPGAYSLYPNSADEEELVRMILNTKDSELADIFVYVADINQLDKQLLLLTQMIDLNLPVILLLNMADQIDIKDADQIASILTEHFNIQALCYSALDGQTISTLKNWIQKGLSSKNSKTVNQIHQLSEDELSLIKNDHSSDTDYKKILKIHHENLNIENKSQTLISAIDRQTKNRLQINETLSRYEDLSLIENKIRQIIGDKSNSNSDKIDQIVTHKILGPIIFFFLLLLVFQAIYSWAAYPADLIDLGIFKLSEFTRTIVPDGKFLNFLQDGLIAGIGGILIFIPQIAILFFLVGIMEESGYMARAVYMFDHVMKKFGMSGRSMVSLISAGACAIPAIMSTKTIENKKERLITILVSPFISCSARIPVYTILIGLAVPAITIAGLFDLRALVFMGLYFLSALSALFAGFILSKVFKRKNNSPLLIEFPAYKIPSLSNVLFNTWRQTKMFVFEAGKIILIISMVLWFLGSYGPSDSMKLAEENAIEQSTIQQLSRLDKDNLIASQRLEASYAGRLGKFIEPVIEPLGYDWKMGIAILASFAAREVFVGTISTIYSMGQANDDQLLLDRLSSEINATTGKKAFNFATSISLLLFFVYAMQCMTTLAVVKRETNGWKWPLIQFFAMSGIAYIAALIAYQVLK